MESFGTDTQMAMFAIKVDVCVLSIHLFVVSRYQLIFFPGVAVSPKPNKFITTVFACPTTWHTNRYCICIKNQGLEDWGIESIESNDRQRKQPSQRLSITDSTFAMSHAHHAILIVFAAVLLFPFIGMINLGGRYEWNRNEK